MVPFIEAHFSAITSQSSVYGLTSMRTKINSHKVLMASSKRKIFCVDYSENQKILTPSSKEVQFTYIPGGSEIISIDCFNQTFVDHGLIVGITFIKSDNGGKQSQYFNIYSDRESTNECDLDNIAQGCLSISLDFIPFQLTHAELTFQESKEYVWLLSGSDCKIHMYKEDKSHQTYCEESSKLFFPEFEELPSIVLWMDFANSPSKRTTAYGCKDGTLAVTVVKFQPEVSIESSWQIQHDGPISVIKLFYDSDIIKMQRKGSESEDSLPLNLLVGNTLEVSVVYRDVLRKGLVLSSQWILPGSNNHDCVTCGLIADINMDGHNELILGTYGQELLAYEWEPEGKDKKGSYNMFYNQPFPNPLLAIKYLDITGDALKELLVLSTKGLHILQHDLKKAAELCVSRMKQVFQEKSSEELEKILNECTL